MRTDPVPSHTGCVTDPTSRALKLLSLLGHRPVWPGPVLAAELGVTPRTLRRDVDRLRNLGYTVDAEPGQGGGYALRRGQALPALSLDEDEALAVNVALAAAAGYLTDAHAGQRALAKIDAVLPPAARARAQETRAATDLSGAGMAVDSAILAACADGTRRRRRLRFSYVDRRGRHSERWVEPHQVSCRGQVWYLAAYDVAREAWRSFRLDRMAEVRVGDWVFRRRPDAAEALERTLDPVPLEAYEHEVVLHVRCPIESAPDFMTWDGAILRELEPGLCEYVTGTDDPEEAASWLTGIEYEFTVIENPEVREALAELGERLLRAAGGARREV
ncbi:transcriptional regulator [Kocuria sp. WRN011]|nr:transcriptional regulator [Kocuria sp. WRN011]